jgi:hypothetical protein
MAVTWVPSRLMVLGIARVLWSLATSLATKLTARNVCGLPERQRPARNGSGLARSGVRLAITPSGIRPASQGATPRSHSIPTDHRPSRHDIMTAGPPIRAAK